MENTIGNSAPSTAPISNRERIRSVDTLRGVALFGILLMNIVGFAYPFAAYFDPRAMGGMDPLNLGTFITVDILFEGSMRAIFSMLFGAGLLIFAAKPGADSGEIKRLYYRRTVLLICFGLFNAYILVWAGDILYVYGMAGLLLYFFRNLSAMKLVICASIILLGLTLSHSFSFYSTKTLWQQVETIESIAASQSSDESLSTEQQAVLDAWEEQQTLQLSSPEAIEAELAFRKSGYIDVVIGTAAINVFLQTFVFAISTLWDALALMLLGMAFMKWGLFDASRSLGFYLKMMVLGFAVGIPLNAWETLSYVNSGFAPQWSASNRPSYDLGRLSLAIAYIGLIMVICKAGVLQRLSAALASVGQMALTNYLSQSVICGVIFLGFGFNLAGELERHQIYFIVFATWLFQLVFSVFWMNRYKFGPAEWLWRSLTYKSRQPFSL